jgi:mono/diheme cytochrome c family protein
VKRWIRLSTRLRTVPAGAVLAALLIPGLIACGQKEDTRTAAQKGRTLYSLHCIACHNVDPAKDGSLGPAVAGSSLDLLLARVIRGEYPPGYAPKRSTRLMQKLPMSEEEVKALHAYLNGL